MTETYLYFLTDPRTPRHPRYVGVTRQPMSRARYHAQPTRATGAAMRAWRGKLTAAGVAPMLHVIAAFPKPAAARAAEWRLVRRWQRRGLADCNAQDTGGHAAFAAEWTARNARRAA